MFGRDGTTLTVRSGTMRELLAGLAAHTLDVVLTNSAVRRDGALDLHSHLIDTQPVSLVGHPGSPALRFPDDLRSRPVILPSLDSDIRVAFDREMALSRIRPVVLAEVDDMAMLRLLARESGARESGALALVPPIVVQDELRAGTMVEHHRLEGVTENFYAVVHQRRFPNPLLAELLPGGRAT